jgi:hypothetical protein
MMGHNTPYTPKNKFLYPIWQIKMAAENVKFVEIKQISAGNAKWYILFFF